MPPLRFVGGRNVFRAGRCAEWHRALIFIWLHFCRTVEIEIMTASSLQVDYYRSPVES